MRGEATILRGESRIACVLDEIDVSSPEPGEPLVGDSPEVSLFSGLAKERSVVARYLRGASGGQGELPRILLADSRKLIFGCRRDGFPFVQRAEYLIELRVPLKVAGPVKVRKVLAAFVVERVFNEEERLCAVCAFSRLRAEDARFLDERARAR